MTSLTMEDIRSPAHGVSEDAAKGVMARIQIKRFMATTSRAESYAMRPERANARDVEGRFRLLSRRFLRRTAAAFETIRVEPRGTTALQRKSRRARNLLTCISSRRTIPDPDSRNEDDETAR